VGIYDRNYFRGTSGGWGSGPRSWPPVCKAIVLINIGVFIAQLLITRPPTIAEVRENSYDIETEYDFVEAYIEDRQNGGESDEDFIDNIAQRKLIEMLLGKKGRPSRKKSKEPENVVAESDTSQPTTDDAVKDVAATDKAAPDDSEASEPKAAESQPPASESPAVSPADTAKAESSTKDSDDAELRQEAELAYHEYLADQVAFSPRVSVVQQWLELDTDKVMKGQIWRVLTSAFCHDRHGLFHILFNMLGLIWFGIALEYMYGQREFLLFYLAAGILSGLAYVGLDLWTGESVPAIGASGAVMGVLMLYACHYPNHTIRIWFFFPIEMRWLVLLYVAFDLHPLLLQLAGDQVFTGVAHAAHLGGLAFGFVYWNQRLRLAPMADSLQRFDLAKSLRRKFRSNNLKLHSPNTGNGRTQGSATNDAETLDQNRVDELLTKITEVGRDKLTDEELGILKQASERLRQKKK
jgi:membrane associated rhomboid family serine protease